MIIAYITGWKLCAWERIVQLYNLYYIIHVYEWCNHYYNVHVLVHMCYIIIVMGTDAHVHVYIVNLCMYMYMYTM